MRVFKLSSKKIINFKNTFLINNYIEIKKYLGPHGSHIFYELNEAIKYNNYLQIFWDIKNFYILLAPLGSQVAPKMGPGAPAIDSKPINS